MRQFVIDEDELNIMMSIWRVPTPSGYISKKMKFIESSIRNRVLHCNKCGCEVIT